MRVWKLIAIFAAGLLAGWEINGNRLAAMYSDWRDSVTHEYVQSLRNAQKAAAEAEQTLADLDKKHTEALRNAQTLRSAIFADIDAGARRLSVPIENADCPGVPEAASATRVDNDRARAELDPAAAGRLVRIAGDGDDAIRQLTALQEYVNTICRPER